ncbi:MAG: nucleotidyltransferase domain-containing protein [bacterium]|nr:nucleotidyltransferase domain-containing protein [bacterium]
MTKDKNVIKIKELIKLILPDCRIILFGSRGRGNFNNESDYDILIIVRQELSIKEKRHYASQVTNRLGEMDIPADVIVRTEKDVIYYKDKIESVTREALLEGVTL